MMPTAALYGVFQRAGFLVPCTWQPGAVGAQPISAAVRYRLSTTEPLDGLGLQEEPSFKMPAEQFAGIGQGDTVQLQVTVGTNTTTYTHTVREVHLISEGRERLVLLRR